MTDVVLAGLIMLAIYIGYLMFVAVLLFFVVLTALMFSGGTDDNA